MTMGKKGLLDDSKRRMDNKKIIIIIIIKLFFGWGKYQKRTQKPDLIYSQVEHRQKGQK
jgi:hypothetical protein